MVSVQLDVATPRQWATAMVEDLDHLLIEQAHLEKKAASSALAFLFRWPGIPELQEPLSRLAREELIHFERVVRLLHARGATYGPQRPSSYAARLKEAVRGDDPHRILDELLVAALIEARSSERMALLEHELGGRNPEVERLYRELVAAEERHKEVYAELACAVCGEDVVRVRAAELEALESRIMDRRSLRPGLHSGWGGLVPEQDCGAPASS